MRSAGETFPCSRVLGKPLFDSHARRPGRQSNRIGRVRWRPSSGIPERARPAAGRAVDFIVDTILKGDGDITLVPIGPLTNIAAAFSLEPRLAEKTAICLMGGCVGRMTAEWNILCDPEAAHVVFAAGVQITMVGLDVTEKCRLSTEQVDAIRSADRTINRLCFDLIRAVARGFRKGASHSARSAGRGNGLRPHVLRNAVRAIHVETRSDRLNGATVPIRSDAIGSNAEVCRGRGFGALCAALRQHAHNVNARKLRYRQVLEWPIRII